MSPHHDPTEFPQPTAADYWKARAEQLGAELAECWERRAYSEGMLVILERKLEEAKEALGQQVAELAEERAWQNRVLSAIPTHTHGPGYSGNLEGCEACVFLHAAFLQLERLRAIWLRLRKGVKR